MSGVDGAALSPVGGGGVGELYVFGHVVGGQDGRGLASGACYLERPVFAELLDDPIVAVLYPPAPARQGALVEAGHDEVADSGGGPVGEAYSFGGDVAGADEVAAGALV
jgi:hypothetical protein